MKTLVSLALIFALTAPTLGAPPKAPKGKPKAAAKAAVAKPKPPQPGVKGAGQLAGGAIRFGELFALKSGFTFQILSARYSIDPFECFTPNRIDVLEPETKFLVLGVAIKNNKRTEDNYTMGPLMQAVDSEGNNYDSGSYALKSKPGLMFSPTLKPGQGLGQPGTDTLEVAFKVPNGARIVKIIVKEGREGTSEEVLRFFLAGATEQEAGGKPDPKNFVAPLADWTAEGAVIPPGKYVPSMSFYVKLDGFSVGESLPNSETPEGKQWVFAKVTVKNAWHRKQSVYDFGDSPDGLSLVDVDGEKYRGVHFLKSKLDELPTEEFEPLEERSFRFSFLVPKNVALKSARLGCPRGKLFVFDASTAGK